MRRAEIFGWFERIANQMTRLAMLVRAHGRTIRDLERRVKALEETRKPNFPFPLENVSNNPKDWTR